MIGAKEILALLNEPGAGTPDVSGKPLQPTVITALIATLSYRGVTFGALLEKLNALPVVVMGANTCCVVVEMD